MGGHTIALIQLMHLKSALMSTVTSTEYGKMKEKMITNIIMDTKLWEHMVIVI